MLELQDLKVGQEVLIAMIPNDGEYRKACGPMRPLDFFDFAEGDVVKLKDDLTIIAWQKAIIVQFNTRSITLDTNNVNGGWTIEKEHISFSIKLCEEKIVPKVIETGTACQDCGNVSMYAMEPNTPVGFVCYSCRDTNGWKYQ